MGGGLITVYVAHALKLTGGAIGGLLARRERIATRPPASVG
jgi:hypothetical protein